MAKQTALQTRLLHKMVKRASPEDDLLASRLKAYAVENGLLWPELAKKLECEPTILDHLAACRPPRKDNWRADVDQIALHTGINSDRLDELLAEFTVPTFSLLGEPSVKYDQRDV